MRALTIAISAIALTASITDTQPAHACSAIWIQTASIAAADAPECLKFSVANDPNNDTTRFDQPVIVTIANQCASEATVTCTNGCDWNGEARTVPASSSRAETVPGAATFEWTAEGATGPVDLNVDGKWSDCPVGPLGACSGGATVGNTSPIAVAVMVLWALVVVRRRRIG